MAPQVPGLSRLTEVGRGGFGVVYRAWQEDLLRFVAAKVLTSTVDERTARRFTQECRALGAVSGHPNIVAVYSAGTTEAGEPYLVMPFCDGGSLADRLRDGGVPWRDAVHTGVLLAGALHTAHEAGILHRDIKPGNVLIDAYGNPMLADFGLARIVGEEVSRTSTVVATPAYAAPEILAGEEASRVADVYGLAATVLALIAGHPPFDAPTPDASSDGGHIAAVVYRVLHKPPVDLRERGVPDAVCAALERAMAKDPADRQASALDLALALREAQRRLNEPVTALPVVGRVPGERTESAPPPTLSEVPGTAATDRPKRTMPAAPEPTRRQTREQTRLIPTSGRSGVAAIAVMAVAVLVFIALFFLPPKENTPQAVPGPRTGPDLSKYLLTADDYGINGLEPQPGAASAFAPLFGSPTATAPTTLSRCVGLPVDRIRAWSQSQTFGAGDPVETAANGRTDMDGQYAVQSAVLRMASPADAEAMVTRWPDAFGATCRAEIISSGLVRGPALGDPEQPGSVTGLAESITLPAGMHFRGHRVDVPSGRDVQNEYAHYYADFAILASGDTVLLAVVNSAPDSPDEQAEAVDTAMVAKLRD